MPAESLAAAACIDFKKPGAPLLMMAGSDDNLIPAALVKRGYLRYQQAG